MKRNSLRLFLRHPRTSIRWFLEDGCEDRSEDTDESAGWRQWGSQAYGSSESLQDFERQFKTNLENCDWMPHPEYSVFTQYDQDFYLKRRDEFLHKYKCFYAVSKTIAPRKIIELGTHAGSSADAYISGTPTAEYIGIDAFEDGLMNGCVHEVTGEPWHPREVAQRLFEARGFKNYELIKADLRALSKLPTVADLVVVDAAHDFENEYADLQLALTANPSYIFVDDSDHVHGAWPAIEKFLQEDIKNRVDFFFGIAYVGGGLVIKLK